MPLTAFFIQYLIQLCCPFIEHIIDFKLLIGSDIIYLYIKLCGVSNPISLSVDILDNLIKLFICLIISVIKEGYDDNDIISLTNDSVSSLIISRIYKIISKGIDTNLHIGIFVYTSSDFSLDTALDISLGFCFVNSLFNLIENILVFKQLKSNINHLLSISL